MAWRRIPFVKKEYAWRQEDTRYEKRHPTQVYGIELGRIVCLGSFG
jgi:hypothetical protein